MKKFIIIFIVLCLSFNMNIIPSMAASEVIKEGLYKVADLNFKFDAVHTVQNNSFSEHSLLIILDSNQIIQQVIRLKPQSEQYTLVPIKENYTIIVVGNGKVSIF
ncbi:hypothetical protein CLPUN_07060 [Clostridium puniceum]|uniref:Uncharacterized protein n=1 Tax=Clostridium puniceum TaxID=29367 RepID=A0A1S8TWZ0_9CLOT|nr:hypothetical protein [Clostridium puniceum]OOM81935.1 hypothetical protein CLPUN_07060 [Clostridium puniceum]